ncbi:isopentenyl-diphosphate Delta-isomerase [Algicella marina]|uniref:Isopentenyl-diphosphate Delta-isomerase n=2 Tax=Algicella marina TaxID=2683284 RepID=A0A6P1T6Z4_9RHOB|nr:isopentenyl-diphosphate Delta-isomerase [Algicella marina]
MIPAWENGELKPVDKLEVHRRGLRHPAVSVFVMNGMRTLLQRRALIKYHTPGLWANACCTHPYWGEAAADCATRRLQQELGLAQVEVESFGELEYRAEVGQSLIEHECVHIFVARGDWLPNPNPDEVMATRWVTLDGLREEIGQSPHRFTPWLRIYMEQYAEAIFSQR